MTIGAATWEADDLGRDPALTFVSHPERLILLGMTMPERLLYVVYTERAASGRLRIISARRATRHEQKSYEEPRALEGVSRRDA